MTDFCTSRTALEIDTPQLRATQLVAHPGTLPTITIPVADGTAPGVDGIRRYLHEVAEFFAVPMPSADDLAAALASVTHPGLSAVDVTVAIADGAAQLVVTAVPVPPPGAPVHVAVDDAVPHVHRETDPWWLRMAARTTSRGQIDQLGRWLAGRGLADCVSGGVPLLGALVFEGQQGFVGVENPEPTSVLDHLAQCGAVWSLGRAEVAPSAVGRVWWISPRYDVHPVAQLGDLRVPFDAVSAVPFGRWS